MSEKGPGSKVGSKGLKVALPRFGGQGGDDGVSLKAQRPMNHQTQAPAPHANDMTSLSNVLPSNCGCTGARLCVPLRQIEFVSFAVRKSSRRCVEKFSDPRPFSFPILLRGPRPLKHGRWQRVRLANRFIIELAPRDI